MVRGGEVAFHREELLKGLVAMELRTVVECDCLEVVLVFLKGLGSGLGDSFGSSGVQLFDDGEARHAFYQGEEAVVRIAADDGISFPVAEFQTAFCLWWTF